MGSHYILACDATYRSMAIDSTRKKTAISGIKKTTALLGCLENFTDRMISIISQDILRRGVKTKRNRRAVNPQSVWLNPKNRSNFAPTRRINSSWVSKIAVPLKIFNVSSYGYGMTVLTTHSYMRPCNERLAQAAGATTFAKIKRGFIPRLVEGVVMRACVYLSFP